MSLFFRVWLLFLLVFSLTLQAEPSTFREQKEHIIVLTDKYEKKPVFLKPSFSDPLELSWCIDTALQRNPEIRAAFFAWKSSFEKIRVVSALPDPMIGYTNYIESVETRVGPQKNAYSVSQKIPLPDKLKLHKDKQFRDSQAQYYNYVQKKLEVINRITEVYYEYAYLAEAIALTRENIELLKQFQEVIQVKYASGTAKNQDLLKVQTETEKLRNSLLSLEDMRGPLSARMNTLLNFQENTPMPWPVNAYEEIKEKYSTNEDLEDAEDVSHENPELLSLHETLFKNKMVEKLAKRLWFPDLTIKLTTIDTGEADNPEIVDSGKDPFLLMFSFNLPLWFSKNKARVASARSNIESIRNQLDNKERSLEAQITFVLYKIKDSLRQVRLYNESLIPRAVQTLEVTKSAYESGTVDFLSLIDAQRMLLDFQLGYYRFAKSYYQFLSKLKMLVGKED